jgi:hypothetical protein
VGILPKIIVQKPDLVAVSISTAKRGVRYNYVKTPMSPDVEASIINMGPSI